MFACYWPETYPDRIFKLGLDHRRPLALSCYIWIYCLVWWLIQDAAKVYTYYLLKHFNVFGVNDSAMVRVGSDGSLDSSADYNNLEEGNANGKLRRRKKGE